MVQSLHPVTSFSPCPPWGDLDEVCMRVRAEFLEMPGLTLTLPQAARLFSLTPARCEQVLRALVGAGQLVTDGRAFARAGNGRRSI
jgi:hypothetical protein